MTWRKGLSKELQYHLERAILESYSHKYAIEQAKDKGKAQLWVALAILQKKISELELKTAYLERALQQFFPRKKILSKLERKKQEAEVEKVLKDVLSGSRLKTIGKTKKRGARKTKIRRKKVKSAIRIAKSL